MSRFLEPDRELVVPSYGLAGFYKFEAVGMDEYGQEKYRRIVADWFPNLITDVGLNAIGTCTSLVQANGAGSASTVPGAVCKVGAGTTPPTFGDTVMESYIATAGSLQASGVLSGGAPNYYTGVQNTYRFATGVAAGNLSEVGMGNTAGNTGVLFSRALILDGSGNPTTITILSTEVLDVTYQLRSYAPQPDGSGSFVISGVTYTYVKRGYAVTAANTDLRSTSMTALSADFGDGGLVAANSSGIGGAQSPFGNGPDSVVTLPYSNGSLVRDCTISSSLNRTNINITSIGIRGALGGMQFVVTPAIPKDNTKVLTVNGRFGPWGRYTGAP